MTLIDDARLSLIVNLGRDKFVTRFHLQRLLRRDPPAGIDPHRDLFRTADVINYFANLTCYMLITDGGVPPREAVGTSDRVRLMHDVMAEWLQACLCQGRPSLPPVNDSKGMTFISVVLDTAEGNLAAIGAHDLAGKAASLRTKVEISLQRADSHWVLSSTYVRHIGHLVYAAALIELHRHGDFAGPPPQVLLGPSPNETLLAMFRPHILDAMPDGARFVEMISARKRHLRGDGKLATMSESVSAAAKLWATKRPFAELPEDLRARGDAMLAGLGVPPGAPIVTLHVRESGFNDHIGWDMGLRDADIATYGPAIGWLAASGAYVVRLGDPSMRRAEPRDGLIDYPFSAGRSGAMDIYLAARCRFHIGTASGMSFVPLLFGRPVLMTNWLTPAHLVCSPNVVTLPKLLLDHAGEVVPMAIRCDRYRELLERPDAELHGLSVRDNDPEEIREAVEFLDRAIDAGAGRPVFPPGLFAAQQAVFAASPLRIRPQISPSFWRRHYA